MGLFDGIPGEPGRTGATADLAARFGVPVLLVVDVAGQSQSAAALVRGFATHDDRVRIGGVVLNRVASDRHKRLVTIALEALHIPVLGIVARDPILVAARAPSRPGASGRAWRSRRASRSARGHGRDLFRSRRHSRTGSRRRVSRRDTGILPCRRRGCGSRSRKTQPSPSSIPIWSRAGARPGPRSSRSRRSPTRRRPRLATPAGSPAAIRSSMRGGSPRRKIFARASHASPRRGPFMGNAAATWCSARCLRTRTACAMP